MKGFVLLQNAWSPVYAGHEWPRDRWLAALAWSKTGKRLMRVLPADVWYDNTTPMVSIKSTGRCPPDLDYVRRRLVEVRPTYLIACGLQAKSVALDLWDGPLLAMPHPSHRPVTNALMDKLGEMVASGLTSRLELKQGVGEVLIVEL